MFTLSSFGVLKIAGLDAKKLLQGQVTCDVEKITSFQSSLAAFCNSQGRILSLFYLTFWREAYYLIMPRTIITCTLASLKKYAIFYKVELTDASNEVWVLGGLDKTHLPIVDPLISIPTTERFMTLKTEEIPHLPDSSDLWHSLNIRENIPSIYPETTAQFLPHELNLPQLQAIDFEKGCYTGQEIIARMHYRGKLKNMMRQVSIKTAETLIPGQELATIGQIVDAVKTENDDYLVLAVGRIA